MARAVWTKLLSDASIQRSSQTLAVVAGNAYLYGGELQPREPVDSTVYRIAVDCDGATDSRISPMIAPSTPQPRVGAASTAIKKRVYVFSGRGGTAMTPIEEAGSFWVLDPTTSGWSQVTPADPQSPYPVGRSYHAIANDGKDTIFLHAGCPEKGRLSDLWAFNIVTRQWRELAPAPKPERGGTSIAYAEGKIFRMNGFDGNKEQGGALDVFDPEKNVWNTIMYSADGISGPSARSVSCLLSLKVSGRPSLVTMFGEHDPSSLGHQGAGKMLADAWIFDIESQKWTKIEANSEEAPQGRGWFDADVIPGASQPSILVHGGLAESNDRLGDVWRLDL
ncbi:kelch repeat-containing protein [Aspergillus sclerotioniger CBS 115572]|uniref:Kelch repeat-containing protein n=1 Tax=Aspergillus sclerotioniger CBS 115572 TaxID=1450535 RepID=A0A317XDP9_9EURO|nr:kelch repeat-containing protein [Aspergillus sclerotioniger CBS 115572]PWY96301.1 kelch repeat-containing protein [Aspergillus sclerotioniger CBS 115572]